MKKIDRKVKQWMESLGFQANLDAKIPNFQLSIKSYLEPNRNLIQVSHDSKEWDSLDDVTIISPEVAKLFYLNSLEFNKHIHYNKSVIVRKLHHYY